MIEADGERRRSSTRLGGDACYADDIIRMDRRGAPGKEMCLLLMLGGYTYL